MCRPPVLSDYRQWIAVRGANQAGLKPFEPSWPKDWADKAFFERRTQRQIQDWQTGRAYAFLILKPDQTLIGGVNINNVCRGAAQFASLGYWLDTAHQGQGYMHDALGLIAEFAFEDLGLHRLNASCIPRNTRSKNLLLRSGFQEEGFARKYLRINGVWEDHHLFGLPVETWRVQQKS